MAGLAGASSGCEREPERILTDSQRAALQGGAGDSLAKLARLLPTDSNPRAIAQAMLCEQVRLARVYGSANAEIMGEVVLAEVRKETDPEARRRVDNRLANNMFSMECKASTDSKIPDSTASDSQELTR
jgi:hypothetical protein